MSSSPPIGSTSSIPIIELRDVKKYFFRAKGLFGRRREEIKAVDGVSLSVNESETYALVGESGSGKSTTANIILGLEQPTAGVVLANNQVISGQHSRRLKEFRTWAQAVFQDPANSLDFRMRVAEVIAEPLVVNRPELNRSELRARVSELLMEVGLPQEAASRFPHEFSGGQRQRIAIARALALQPRLVVLDEPVSALDVSISAQIINLLKDLQGRRTMSYFLIAHNLATVSYMADRVGVMYCGRIVETGPSREVFASPRHPYTKLLLRAATPERLGAHDESLVLRGEPASPLDPPSGCRFHPRCPYVMPICPEVEPTLKEVAAGHAVACHL